MIILRIVHAIRSICGKNNTEKSKFFEKSNFINFFIRKLFLNYFTIQKNVSLIISINSFRFILLIKDWIQNCSCWMKDSLIEFLLDNYNKYMVIFIKILYIYIYKMKKSTKLNNNWHDFCVIQPCRFILKQKLISEILLSEIDMNEFNNKIVVVRIIK